MQAITQSELLDAWERAFHGPAVQRAVTLLTAAYPDQTPQQLAELGLAERDARLLSLREQTFGAAMLCVTACPSCGERVEVGIETSEIRSDPNLIPEGGWALNQDGMQVHFRPPNTLDLIEIGRLTNPASARRELLSRCLISIEAESGEKPTGLSESLQQAVIAKMTEHQAQADLHISLKCPTCYVVWDASLDIGSYFWTELDAWARRALWDIHCLALAYGWNEAEILSLSPRRRKFYLEMLQL